jgi:ribose 5-phosphate isomerase A
MMNLETNIAKKAAGYAAADLIQDHMLIGIGTGTTVFHFITRLAERCREGLRIKAVASSGKTEQLAIERNIPITDINRVVALDLTVDGADEIDPQKRMIKGGGGALLREKILASMSREMFVIVDSNKQVEHLGAFPLPIEITPFGSSSTIYKITQLGFNGKLRVANNQEQFFVTDNGNYIYDITFPEPLLFPEAVYNAILPIPGIVEIGFFFNLASQVFVGYEDGSVQILS